MVSAKDSVIISGGCDFTIKSSVSHIKKFSLETRTWSDVSRLLDPVDCHGSVLIDEQLYTVGGRYTENGEIKKRYVVVICCMDSILCCSGSAADCKRYNLCTCV